MNSANDIEIVAEDFLCRLRRGEDPRVDEYCARYPELAKEMEQFLPALCLLEKYHFETRVATTAAALPHRPLDRVGDYEIIREIGRGGMGVVYEARQKSLDRSVALKLLPDQPLLDESRQKRFEREARAVARLHHMNIVPIFGVGQDDGVRYYVMQLIDGVSLDEVIKRVDLTGKRPRVNDRVSGEAASPRRSDNTPESDPPGSVSDESGSQRAIVSADAFAVHLLHPGSEKEYWREVARVGVQLGRALQYAHDHGIVHRDIKPSNILIDREGNSWITDFGLAKAEGLEELTRAGDVLGTLRYMAPEQFDGQADVRSDVWSLGLTLYELLVLRPAFPATQRQQLMKEITTTPPEALACINAAIPKDLRAVIHKSIEIDPKRRYPSGGALADDLQKFLDHRPIKARHITPVGRFLRWSARHPAAASLAALLTIVSVVTPLIALYLASLVIETRQAHHRSQVSLFESRKSEAAAHLVSGRPGQQFDTLIALNDAVKLSEDWAANDGSLTKQLRSHATAALALPDIKETHRWPIPQPSRPSTIHFDANLDYYTTWDSETLVVRSVAAGAEVARLKVNPQCQKARFSPDGRLISITSEAGSGDAVEVWDWRRNELIYRVTKPAMLFATNFSSDSKLLAIGHVDGSVTIHDLEKRQEAASFDVASAPSGLAFHPAESVLAVNCQTAYHTEIWQLDPLKIERTLPHPSDVFGLGWGPQGRFLAVVEGYQIYIWDLLAETQEPLQILKGHSWVVSEVNFHPNGRHLVSHSWREGETFLWDVFPGKMLFSCEGMQSRFNRDGSRLAFRAVDSVGIWKVSLGQAYLSPPTYTATTLPVEHCDYSPDGTLLAAAGHSRIDIWNTKTWRLLERLEMQRPLSVHFDPSGESLLVCHKTGLDRIPIHRSGNEIFTGEQESLPFPADVAPFHLAQSQDGRTIVADLIRPIEWTSAESLWLYSDGQQPRVLKAYESLRFITCTPDGRWAATGNWTGQGAVIWDLTTGQPMRRFDTASNCVVAFGPKGERLAIADTNSLTLRESHSWRVEHQIPRASLFAALAFSSDARMLAMTDSDSRIQLLDVNEARVVATLGTNDNPSYISWMRFRPDGKQLAVCLAVDGLRVWDLRKLRDGLRELNLDWDW